MPFIADRQIRIRPSQKVPYGCRTKIPKSPLIVCTLNTVPYLQPLRAALPKATRPRAGTLTEVLYPVVSLDNHVHYVHRALAMPSDLIGRSNGSSEIRKKLAISTKEITRGVRGSLVISQGSANVILKFPYLGSWGVINGTPHALSRSKWTSVVGCGAIEIDRTLKRRYHELEELNHCD